MSWIQYELKSQNHALLQNGLQGPYPPQRGKQHLSVMGRRVLGGNGQSAFRDHVIILSFTVLKVR